MVAHRQVCNLSEPQFPHLQNKEPQHLPHGVVGRIKELDMEKGLRVLPDTEQVLDKCWLLPLLLWLPFPSVPSRHRAGV